MPRIFSWTGRRCGSIDGGDKPAASTHPQTRDHVSDAPGSRRSAARSATLKIIHYALYHRRGKKGRRLAHEPLPKRVTRLVRGLAGLARGYEVILSDVWGVVHNGRVAFESATE